MISNAYIQNDDQFEYDFNEAAEFVWENMPMYLRSKYDLDDILKILELEADFLDSIGVLIKDGEEPGVCEFPIETDWNELLVYIVTNAIKNDIYLNYEDLQEILDAETMFLDEKGVVTDAGEWFN